MFECVERSYGRLDVLVNNVGDYLEKPLAFVSIAEWDAILRSNLHSVFLCTREALPMMRRAGKGRVITIGYAPVGKVMSSAKCAVYHLAKLGVLSLTKAFAAEEARNGITVNMISPGTLFNSVKKPSRNAEDYIPAGRFCQYRDIHGALDYLLGAQASYVTGGHFVLSGGYAI
jgi:NAD(P)-dependent dehydrogenase (short-subunit alcohol dehydrogenase family)